MELIYATMNQSKVKHMESMLKGTSFTVISLKEVNIPLKEPIEDGLTPLDNAVIKAKSYYNQIRKPVYSTDFGLYFEGVKEEDQPGVLIKRLSGKNLEGKEFQKFYMELAKKYGGKITAYYKNSICVVLDEHTVITYDGSDIDSEKFYIVDTPHDYFESGFPLNSLSVEIDSGLYYNDIQNYKAKGNMDQGIIKFFSDLERNYIKLSLCKEDNI